MNALQAWAHDLKEISLHPGGEISREALSEIFENIPLAIAVTLGPEHRYAFANKLFRSGLSAPGDPTGRTLQEVLGARYTAETQALRQYVLDTGKTCEVEGLICDPGAGQGETVWDIKFLPVRDPNNQVCGILTLGADVTERVNAGREASRQAREAAINSKRLALAVAAAELGLWDWDAVTDRIYWSDRQKEIFGIGEDAPLTHDLWAAAIHPEDRDRVVGSVSALMDPHSTGRLNLEYRIVRPDGKVRCISSRGRMVYETVDGALKPVRLLGTILDITDRRRNEEARQLLVQELNHRVKNLFAMATGMVTLTAKAASSPKEMAVALRGRLEALARSHELIRPAIGDGEPNASETSIADILRTILAPHIDPLCRENTSRLSIHGPFVPVAAKAATGLTLVLHELATNASKYGALSVPDGSIRIRYARENEKLVLDWREMNGPVIEAPPKAEGFGSKLARKSVTEQLGGQIAYDWCREGLHVRMELPLDPLAL